MTKILGVDFDNTLFLNSFPENFTEPNWPVIDYVRKKQSEGWYLILVTCRTSADLIRSALCAAESVGIYFDDVNANHPDQIEKWGDCRKIYCDEYIDDKNVAIKDLQPKANSDEINEQHKPIVYISGKMRGLEDLGRTHFNLAEMYMREKGFVVLNPSRLPDGMSDEKYMPICLSMLDAADAVLMLNGWSHSKGAQAEYHYAVCQGKTILLEDELTEGT